MSRILGIVFGIAAPRFTIAILALFTSWFSGVFSNIFWPILGFIFVPYALLWYSAVENWFGGEWGVVQTVVLIIAVIFDITPAKKLLGR